MSEAPEREESSPSEGQKGGRKTAIILMWVGALVAVAAIYLNRAQDDVVREVPSAPGAPVVFAGDNESGSRELVELSPLEEGPPSQFRGDRRHTGQSPYAGPDGVELAWSFETEGRITAQPVVDGDGRVFIASHDGKLYVLNAFGSLQWEADLRGPIYSTPLVDAQGRSYVGTDAGYVYAFDADGEVRWRFQTAGDADTAPTFTPDGDIVIAAGEQLLKLSTDGDLRWRFEAREKIYSSPAVDDDGTIYFGSQDDHFYAVAADGQQRWAFRCGDDVDASPVLGPDGTIYAGSDDHHVYAWDRNGTLKWSIDLDGMVRAPLGLSRDGSVLAGVFGPRPRVVSLNAERGELDWYFPVTVHDTTEIGVASGPLVDRDGNIYFGAHDDYLYAVAPTGELRWTFLATDDIDSSPIITPRGELIVGSDDRRVYAIRSPQGPAATPEQAEERMEAAAERLEEAVRRLEEAGEGVAQAQGEQAAEAEPAEAGE